jgi:hypothetical protein
VVIDKQSYVAPQTFGLAADVGQMLFSDGSSVFVVDLKTSKQSRIAKGSWASCSCDGKRFSFCNEDGYLVVGELSDPAQTITTPLKAFDGMEWSPDGKCGLIAQPARFTGLFSRPNQLMVVNTTDWSATSVLTIPHNQGSGGVRWVSSVEGMTERLQEWVDTE